MDYYISADQQQEMNRLGSTWTGKTEWPTWLLIFTIYGSWLAVLLASPQLGVVPSIILLAVISAWHMSLQHELVHGHPTRYQWINQLLGYPSLAIWYPYTLYKQSHLAHHVSANITHPRLDPQEWQTFSPGRARIWRLFRTVAGRLLMSPLLMVISILEQLCRDIFHLNMHRLRMWGAHIATMSALLMLVSNISVLSAWQYILFVSYPALSIALMRSFFEHRAKPKAEQRCVLNEASWPARLLYLNNNYHLVHHDLPHLPWYFIPNAYMPWRAAYLKRSGNFLLNGYWPLIRHYFLKPIDTSAHPFFCVEDSARFNG